MDIESDTFYPLNRAPIPGNPSAPTRWRWRLHGVRGVRLETVTIGGRVFVTKRALEEFIDAASKRSERPEGQQRTPARRERDIRRAERELRDAGV